MSKRHARTGGNLSWLRVYHMIGRHPYTGNALFDMLMICGMSDAALSNAEVCPNCKRYCMSVYVQLASASAFSNYE